MKPRRFNMSVKETDLEIECFIYSVENEHYNRADVFVAQGNEGITKVLRCRTHDSANRSELVEVGS